MLRSLVFFFAFTVAFLVMVVTRGFFFHRASELFESVRLVFRPDVMPIITGDAKFLFKIKIKLLLWLLLGISGGVLVVVWGFDYTRVQLYR